MVKQAQDLGMRHRRNAVPFGWGRAESATQQMLADRGRNRAALQAQLLTQGFDKAIAAQQQKAATLGNISAQQANLGQTAKRIYWIRY